MPIFNVDFETYYDSEYSLSSLSTEAYIRDPRFEVIGVSVSIGDSPPRWLEEAEFRTLVEGVVWGQHDWMSYHTQFDGAIAAWHYGVNPRRWLCSLSMARAVVGGYAKSFSLGAISKALGVGEKGTEVIRAKGKHRRDFTSEEWLTYGDYSNNDNNLSRAIYLLTLAGQHGFLTGSIDKFPDQELEVIDATVRMFTEPRFMLDRVGLSAHLANVKHEKEAALARAGVTDKALLMSNPKFASLLRAYGVPVPMKTSLVTGKPTYAFAKTDKGMEELLEHPLPEVQALVAARIKNKTTLEETRTQKMLAVEARGLAPMYIKYAGADQTQRASGGDGINWQNNPRGGMLRWSMMAPPGHVCVVIDSSNVEARGVDTLAGEKWALEVYRLADAGEGPDFYCTLASRYYSRVITKADTVERQFGKILKLAAGFGMGGDKFVETARISGRSPITPKGVIISPAEGRTAITTYRNAHTMVVALWRHADNLLDSMWRGAEESLLPAGLVRTCKQGLVTPSGLTIKYPNLRKNMEGRWVYDSGRISEVSIYGGKIIENVVQKLCRDIVMGQSLQVRREFKQWNLTVHDEGVFIVPNAIAERVAERSMEIFKQPPDWWPDIRLSAEVGIARRYGEA